MPSRLPYAVLAALGWGLAVGISAGQDLRAESPATPIIAEITGDGSSYVGRRVTIYGVVVESKDPEGRFQLQDVSQRPLHVVAPDGHVVVRGMQVMVTGKVAWVRGRHELVGEELLHVQVVAGGGCC